MRRLRGWQAVVRRTPSGETLVVVHCFAKPPETLEIPIPTGLSVIATFGHAVPVCEIEDGILRYHTVPEWTGWCLYLGDEQN